jgi:hypothetical protein
MANAGEPAFILTTHRFSLAYPSAGRGTRETQIGSVVGRRCEAGGAGTASRSITVAQTTKPRVKLPRGSRRGKLTARVTCAERCNVTARMRIDGRTRVTVGVRHADGRSTTARRTIPIRL